MDNIFALAEKSKSHIDNIDPALIEQGLRIRLVEETFLELFSLGKIMFFELLIGLGAFHLNSSIGGFA